jgi:hypothetical protein
VSSPRYIDDIENIEHLFIAVMKGLSSLLYTLIRVTVGLKGIVAFGNFVTHSIIIYFSPWWSTFAVKYFCQL